MNVNISKEEKDQIIEAIKEYFYQERSEEIGDLAAHNFYDFLNKQIGLYFYNQGVKDAARVVEQQMMNINEDVLSLARPMLPNRR